MRFLVMGAGAIGSVAGGLLAEAGHDVTLVGRAAHMSAIRAKGLRITGIWGDHVVSGLGAFTSVNEISSPVSFDVIFIATKSYDTAAAVRDILPLLAPDSLVVSLQNGLGTMETIAGLTGLQRAVGGRVIFGAELVEPGRVAVTVYGGDVMLGSPEGPASTRIQALAATCTAAGIPTQATDDILSYIWGKVLYNGSLNALSALLGMPYGALLRSEPARQLMGTLITEMFAVARAAGARLPWQEPEDYRRVLFEELIPMTGAHYASMHADLRQGKRTEIDALNGAIVRLGQRHGIPTPVNATLTLLIKTAEERGLAASARTEAG